MHKGLWLKTIVFLMIFLGFNAAAGTTFEINYENKTPYDITLELISSYCINSAPVTPVRIEAGETKKVLRHTDSNKPFTHCWDKHKQFTWEVILTVNGEKKSYRERYLHYHSFGVKDNYLDDNNLNPWISKIGMINPESGDFIKDLTHQVPNLRTKPYSFSHSFDPEDLQ
ncbi:hypothetical protein D5R81_13020 [Parashewanella spongiae]|uniref:Uncharacterized protein n=1 Tax=Parashewanella spongiae TaxID=342950 RepID=A0A3A6TKK9_9GAMM|nr:hypothetical protein [Parashewanella spongiae]MCL1078924.1 hypothetical protein [Parashewanella spongiae]RJY11540.1 hypothetical protein D5R81_13020 [Parashewanella spongiae]